MDFKQLSKWNEEIAPFSVNTRLELWTYPQTAKKMLQFHLDDNSLASAPKHIIKKRVDFITQYFKLDKNSTICDFGCGPGLYTSLFAKKNIQVTGIDFSQNSIEFAKTKAKNENLVIDYKILDYSLFNESYNYDLITLIFFDYCVIEKEKRIKILKNIKKALKSNGHFYFDVLHKPTFYEQKPSKSWNYSQSDGFWFEEEYIELYENILYTDEKITLSKHYISGKQGEKFIYNWAKYFSLEEIKEELSEVGFGIIDVFSDINGSKYYNDSHSLAIVAK